MARAASRRAQTPPRTRLARGVVLVLLAAFVAGCGRLLASSGHHAYDPNAVPRSSYHLLANRTYQLSLRGGPAHLSTPTGTTGSVDPQCSYVPVDAPGTAPRTIQLQSRRDDPRDLHLFATFSIAETGNFAITCAGIGKVFVDDADNSGTGYSTLLVVLAAVVGAWGVGLTVSGLAGNFPAPGASSGAEPGQQLLT